jgi:YVTN family beta-propeller protein
MSPTRSRAGHAASTVDRSVAALTSLAVAIGLAFTLVACGQATPTRPAETAAMDAASPTKGAPVPPGSPQVMASAPASTPTPTPGLALPVPDHRSGTTATEAGPNVYAGAGAGMFSPTVASFPPRVYVPDEASGTVVVVDPATYRILFRYKVGASPEHVTPDWDLRRLYVEASFGDRLTVIDPTTGRPIGHHAVPGPYNLYFTLDGRMAIVVLDSRRSGVEYGGQKQLRFYDRRTWRLTKSLDVPYAGADHLDLSADGRYFLLSTEYTGRIVKVDIERMAIVGVLNVGGEPIDVRLAPAGDVFYVANQGTNGVSIIDGARLRQIAFLRTGRGAHGLAISRDARWLYITNRLAGSLSAIDFSTRRVIRTWKIGGSPDMIAVSPDGNRLWISNRFGGTVSVVDAHTGRLIRIVRVGGRPHGLAFFPEPGSLSLGHNGIYR